MQRQVYDCTPGCPVESTLQVIAGKWKSVILYHCIYGRNMPVQHFAKTTAGLFAADASSPVTRIGSRRGDCKTSLSGRATENGILDHAIWSDLETGDYGYGDVGPTV